MGVPIDEIPNEVVVLSREISQKMEKLSEFFPEAHRDKQLRHVAAAAIHMALFMKELVQDKEVDDRVDAIMKQFTDKCGCNHIG